MTTEVVKHIGLKDQPIEGIAQEALGLDEYAEVLTEFIRGCDTPLTIALQGDWGSGKTSLMTLIRNALDPDPESTEGKPYLTVWFNTWQYAQFNMSNTLALSMMSKITDALVPDAKTDGLRESVKQNLWAITRAVAIGGASLIGQADTMKEVANEVERPRAGTGPEDPATALERIKDGLNEIVQERVSASTEKVIVFIDDLDRLVPERAVDLLEAMKIFLDIDRCVYVIACDYGVVATGLKAKFGINEGELKGKSFFDKIIQVPFKMPTRRYQVDQYIERLLKQIGMDCETNRDIEKYRELVDHSVGFNPRTMKRLLNTLQLLMILEDKRQRRADGGSESDNDEEYERRRHAYRVMFGILCMLERYEAIYDHLTDDLSANRLVKLRDGLEKGKEFEALRNQIGKDDKEGEYDEAKVKVAVEFVETFVDCLQLDEDDELSDDEMQHLAEMLSQSALVSSARLRRDFAPRDFAVELRRALNTRYSDFIISKKPKYDKFRMEQGVVYLYLPRSVNCWFQMGQDDEEYYFELRSEMPEHVYKIGGLLCERLCWEKGVSRSVRGHHTYSFFRQSVADRQAFNKFKREINKRFDQLTKPIRQLYDLSGEAMGL